jgi:hypothetical protein
MECDAASVAAPSRAATGRRPTWSGQNPDPLIAGVAWAGLTTRLGGQGSRLLHYEIGPGLSRSVCLRCRISAMLVLSSSLHSANQRRVLEEGENRQLGRFAIEEQRG